MRKRDSSVLLAGILAAALSVSAAAAPAAVYGESETETSARTVQDTAAEAGSQGAAQAASAAARSLSGTEKASGEISSQTETGEDGDAAAEAEDAGSADKPSNPEEEGITAADAVKGARALYSKMKHYAEVTDNDSFSACFEKEADASVLQSRLAQVQAADTATKGFDRHADICYFDPTADRTQSPYYFGVGLTDYRVQRDGTVEWYSVLLRVAKYGNEWKASELPENPLPSGLYPEGYEEARRAGRNAVDLYPYLALRFSDSGVFSGSFYSLVNMAWQNGDGSLSAALWIANGQDGEKWCDSIDLILEDGEKTVASVNAPVQQALEPGAGTLVTVNIPKESVKTGTAAWSGLTVQSNLLYQ